MKEIERIERELAGWIHDSSWVPRYKWNPKTEVPECHGRYRVPDTIELDIDPEWLEKARLEPRDGLQNLLEQVMQQTDVEFMELDLDEFLAIIGPLTTEMAATVAQA